MANTLLNVELFKDALQDNLGGKRKLAQFVEVESAEGLQVGKFKLAVNEYVGDATVVGAGQAIPVSDLKQTKKDVSFEKIAKGVKVTDEEMKQTFGDPIGNAQNQTVASIAGKMEAKIATLLAEAVFTVEYEELTNATILEAIGTMGEALEDAPYYLVVNPADYAELQAFIKPSDNTALNGTIYGAGIVMSSRIPSGELALVQSGAIKEIVQKDVDVEEERDASTKSTKIFTDKIHAVYIQDDAKLVYIKPTI